MYALVRFLRDEDNKVYTVPTTGITDFNPTDVDAFDPKQVYSAFWDDPNSGEDSGHYTAQILMMAGQYVCLHKGLF